MGLFPVWTIHGRSGLWWLLQVPSNSDYSVKYSVSQELSSFENHSAVLICEVLNAHIQPGFCIRCKTRGKQLFFSVKNDVADLSLVIGTLVQQICLIKERLLCLAVSRLEGWFRWEWVQAEQRDGMKQAARCEEPRALRPAPGGLLNLPCPLPGERLHPSEGLTNSSGMRVCYCRERGLKASSPVSRMAWEITFRQ